MTKLGTELREGAAKATLALSDRVTASLEELGRTLDEKLAEKSAELERTLGDRLDSDLKQHRENLDEQLTDARSKLATAAETGEAKLGAAADAGEAKLGAAADAGETKLIAAAGAAATKLHTAADVGEAKLEAAGDRIAETIDKRLTESVVSQAELAAEAARSTASQRFEQLAAMRLAELQSRTEAARTEINEHVEATLTKKARRHEFELASEEREKGIKAAEARLDLRARQLLEEARGEVDKLRDGELVALREEIETLRSQAAAEIADTRRELEERAVRIDEGAAETRRELEERAVRIDEGAAEARRQLEERAAEIDQRAVRTQQELDERGAEIERRLDQVFSGAQASMAALAESTRETIAGSAESAADGRGGARPGCRGRNRCGGVERPRAAGLDRDRDQARGRARGALSGARALDPHAHGPRRDDDRGTRGAARATGGADAEWRRRPGRGERRRGAGRSIAELAEMTLSTKAQSAAAQAIRDLTATARDLSLRIEAQAGAVDVAERLDEVLAGLRVADQRLRESDERTRTALRHLRAVPDP